MPAKRAAAKSAPKKKPAAKAAARAAGMTPESYIAGVGGWRAEAMTALRAILKAAAPDATESIKWGQPVYEVNGPFAYFRAHTASVNFGFWRGVDLADPAGLLRGTGGKMRHVKLLAMADVKPAVLKAMVKEAAALNREKGDPTKG